MEITPGTAQLITQRDTAVGNPQVKNDAVQKTQEAAGNPAKVADVQIQARALATDKPPFDAQKVADIKAQIAAGAYKVDLDNLASRMLDSGVIGVDEAK